MNGVTNHTFNNYIVVPTQQFTSGNDIHKYTLYIDRLKRLKRIQNIFNNITHNSFDDDYK